MTLATLLVGPFGASIADAAPAPTNPVSSTVEDRIAEQGSATVLVTMRGEVPADDDPAAQLRLRGNKAALRDRLGDSASITPSTFERPTRHILMTVDADDLEILRHDPAVEAVGENNVYRLDLATSVGVMGAPVAWAEGFDGAGTSVAIIDTGVQADHPMFGDRVIAQKCFSGGGFFHVSLESLCTGGAATGNTATPCSGTSGCSHGTHVAGIAAGSNGPASSPSGIAPAADIVAVQAFTRVNLPEACGGASACLLVFDVDLFAALDWVHANRVAFDIAAVNMSLGGGLFSGNCDTGGTHPTMKTKLDALRAGGVAPVVASGNDGVTNQMSSPACVSSAISVGAIQSETLAIAPYSNSSSTLDFVAPGSRNNSTGIRSAITGSSYGNMHGTSMATPHVAGAFAVMKQAHPGWTISQIEDELKATGRPMTDSRQGRITPMPALDEAVAPPPAGTFHELDPVRLLDTRTGNGAPLATVGAGKTIDVQIAGRGGVPSDGVSAVVLNVTAIAPSMGGFVTVFPHGSPRPLASNLNLVPSDVRPNLVTVRLGASGKVSLYNAIGNVHLAADIAGWYDSDAFTGDYFHSVAPTRILDTREGLGAPDALVGAGGVLTVKAAGAGKPVPAGASAVVVNLTATNVHGSTYVTAYPGDAASPPLASNLNISAGQTRPNLAIVPLDAAGNFKLYNNAGHTDLIADVQGYYDGDSGGSVFVPTSPTRLLDTRVGTGVATGPLGAGSVRTLQISNASTPDGLTGIVMNVTAVGPTGDGFVTMYPSDPRPTASNLNLVPFVDTPNLATSSLDGSGRVKFYNAAATVHLVGDLAGYFVHLA
jgi:subtilisin family serine protease